MFYLTIAKIAFKILAIIIIICIIYYLYKKFEGFDNSNSNQYTTITDNNNNIYGLFSITDLSNYKNEILNGLKIQFPTTYNSFIQTLIDSSNNDFIFTKKLIVAININDISKLNIDNTKQLILKIDEYQNVVIDSIKYILSTKFENNNYLNIYQLTQTNEKEAILYDNNKYDKNFNIINFISINNINIYLIYEPLNNSSDYIKINI